MLQLMHSFHGLVPPQEIIDGIRDGKISSLCLFAFNVASPTQLYELCRALHEAAAEGGHLPPIIGIDQEGGQLIAVTGGATELPGNMALGATRSPELAEKAGQVLGRELQAMGVNMNFAPSLDINTNPLNPVIGIRSFGEDPDLVSELGAALIRGMQSEGVIATAKHFPGHGDTQSDSHLATPVVAHSLERTSDVELAPFRHAIAHDTGAIMTAHVLFEALDPENPATLSKVILSGLLRDEMGFEGLIITDAMDMHAVAQYGAIPSVRSALDAGADVILLGHLPDQAGIRENTLDLVNPAALERIQVARQQFTQFARPTLDVIGCQDHWDIAQEIADHSITVVRGHLNLPLNIGQNEMVAVITPHPEDLTPADTSSKVRIGLVDAVRKRYPLVQGIEMPFRAKDAEIKRVLEATEKAGLVIVGTINADIDLGQAELVKALHNRGQKMAVIALRTPYDISAFPMIETYLCSYGIRAVSMEAVARVLFGEIEATGVLPCTIPGLASLP